MKRYVYSNIEVSKRGKPRTNNSFNVTIDSVLEFNDIDGLVDSIKEACKPYAVNKYIYMHDCYLDITQEALNQGLSKFGDEFLRFLGQFKNKDDFDEFVVRNIKRFDKVNNRITSRFYDLASQVKNYIDELNLKGVEVNVNHGYLFLKYDLDENKYQLESQERIDNWDKLLDYIRSMNAVSEVSDEFRYEGRQAWAYIYIENISKDKVTHGSVPVFEEVPYMTGPETSYTVTLVQPPNYMVDQRSKFHFTEDNKMYVVHNYKFKCKDDSVYEFIEEMYTKKFADTHTFDDWRQYLDWLAKRPFESKNAFVVDNIVKIVKTQNGKGRTIFKRDLP